ncbi:suppressor of fused domain protein [Criibacterium bergeronii]|uniref:Suppressor of fused domain protein n=1 Tax=Criibacterium bergeronii TaxID=1871336 RepID=A0A552US58_9FIRM|nr:suppressor of fused domain protein [Criibacterium bergeronii]TRW21064.1 suppressor of fused domain protein [Criibacterium bergeronii]
MDINKILAKKELEVIGGKPKIFRYLDEKEERSIDILSSINRPYIGIISCATIGLSGYDIGMVSENKKLGLELLGACDVKEESFPNILATTAFKIIERDNCGYGHIISNVIEQYISDCEMKHIYLMNPFLWDRFNSIEFEDRKVTWLLIVPISNEEKNYAVSNGGNALETKFEEADIDIFNIRRKSIV